jgi:hypothetical protein
MISDSRRRRAPWRKTALAAAAAGLCAACASSGHKDGAAVANGGFFDPFGYIELYRQSHGG